MIKLRDGSSYNEEWYRLEGNMLQVRYTDIVGSETDLYKVHKWRDIKEITL
jgi:hypothetical protein